MEEIPFREINVNGHFSGNVNSHNVMNVVNHYHKGKKIEALAKSTITGPHWMVPYSRNRNFTGREDVIDRIQRLVEDGRRHSRIALCGLGGSGNRSRIRLSETGPMSCLLGPWE
ncbi:hypothetical protein L873DRAFT_1406740 [Choiromyces venosus 120613-1]|uniref:Uncharacterized protein n=1 Tax=Choiromyces venosus 120613-1 TaxID=1336337 RepID=A0A3N4J8V3_9PEZI|nr:hypothetical protein L873DRAFT_1406740 [Choiromyces venosus 120613-1]